MTVGATADPSARSGNPAFSQEEVVGYLSGEAPDTASMRVSGTTLKTLFLLALVVVGGAYGWASASQPVAGDIGPGYANTTVTLPGGFWLASMGALFVGIFTALNPRRAAIGGIIYALLEGYVLGAISAAFDAQTEGVVGAAVLCTLCVFVASLFLYLTRIIRPTRKMAFGVAAGIGGLILMSLLVSIVSIFDWGWLYSDQFRSIGLVIGGLAITLAALSLTLDFGSIEGGVQAGAPRFMEWYCAYGLMVTLVWLYITILRVLALLARNR